MALEFNMSITLQHVKCPKCHIDFAVRKSALLKLYDEGGCVWCPLGHKSNLTTTESNQKSQESKK